MLPTTLCTLATVLILAGTAGCQPATQETPEAPHATHAMHGPETAAVGGFRILDEDGEPGAPVRGLRPSSVNDHGDGVDKEAVRNQLIVRFEDGTSPEDTMLIHDAIGTRLIEPLHHRRPLHLVELPDGLSAHEAIEAYEGTGVVRYAEPNDVGMVESAPVNDPRWSGLWALQNTGQYGYTPGVDLNWAPAWAEAKGGERVVVAVIDTGVDYNHPDLRDNMWRNPREAKNGEDTDRNGYVDDIHGIDAIRGTGDPRDVQGHGTHVAGTIAAVANNNEGIVGVAPNTEIMACRAGDERGAIYMDAVLKCLHYVYDMKTHPTDPVNIVATNHSWRGGGYSRAIKEAFEMHMEAGILTVAGAGNDSWQIDNRFISPAGYDLPNFITVTAIDGNSTVASFANHGQRAVTVAAPGVNIMSLYPGGKYALNTGTSMATPHVTGLAALVASWDPTLEWYGIRNRVLAGAVEDPKLDGKAGTGRRIKAWNDDGSGALSCYDRPLYMRHMPADVGGHVYAPRGGAFRLTATNINCERPHGNVRVDVTPGEGGFLMRDGGEAGDTFPGDGVYTGFWEPGALDRYDLDIHGGEDRLQLHVLDNYLPPIQESGAYRDIGGSAVTFPNHAIRSLQAPFPLHFGTRSKGQNAVFVSRWGFLTFPFNDHLFDTRAYNKNLFRNVRINQQALSNIIAPFWDHLEGGGVYHATLGSAPNREFVVEWRDMRHGVCGGNVTFQVVFFEDGTDILFNYKDVTFGNSSCDAGRDATVGISVHGESNLGRAFSFKQANLTNGLSLRWVLRGLDADGSMEGVDLGDDGSQGGGPSEEEEGESNDERDETSGDTDPGDADVRQLKPPGVDTGGMPLGCNAGGSSAAGLLLLALPLGYLGIRRRRHAFGEEPVG